MLPPTRASHGEARGEVVVTRTVLLSLLLALATSPRAAADVVRFRNGDQLHGTIGLLTGGRLEIRDTVAGTIKVDMLDVATFSTDASAELFLHDGSIVMQPVEDAVVHTRLSVRRRAICRARVFLWPWRYGPAK